MTREERDKKMKEIEEWRNLYPEICKRDGLWQEAPNRLNSVDIRNEILVAIRNVDYLLSKIKELEEQLIDERKWFDRKVDLNVKLIKELSEKEEKIKELEARIQLAEATREDALAYAKMYLSKIEKLEKELENLANGWLKKFNDMESGYLTHIEKMEKGIENHHNKKLEIKRFFANIAGNHPQAQQIPDAVDEELYKLIREKP